MGLGAVEEDVQFNHVAARWLASVARGAASTIDEQAGPRSSWVNTAKTDFKGHFAQLFDSNAQVAAGDGSELATRLRETATQVERLSEEATKEQERREEARAWKERHDNRNVGDHIHDFFFGEEDPPRGPAPEPLESVPAPPVNARETPAPGEGGSGGGGTSSARPSDLRTFADNSGEANIGLRSSASLVRSALGDFNRGCKWGSLSADGVADGFDEYVKANDADVQWARVVADAFARAGSEGSVSSLPDGALYAALQAAGVSASRQTLAIEPAQVNGGPTTSGYSDDPVNTATGNFLLPETDLSFAGGCASLSFPRSYSSLNPVAGAFGPGWSSWCETNLDLGDDQKARWVLPDGRHVLFPRLGQGWDHADGEAYWLERASDGASWQITDNSGGRWVFTAAGRLEYLTRGAGTRVDLLYAGDGRLAGLVHERGRSIELEWDGLRVIAVRASDGREVAYAYDDAGHLVAADGPLGRRAYHWCAEGWIDQVTDADGVIEVANTFDENGRITSQRSPFGRVTKYSYLPGRITVVADADAGADTDTDTPIQRANTWICDARARLIGVIDSDGNRQSMAYDRWGNRVMATERDGATTLSAYDDRGRRIRQQLPSGAQLQWGWDEFDRPTTVIGDGGPTTLDYDGPTERNPARITDPGGGITHLEWTHGLLTAVIDPVGVRVSFDYDAHGDLIATTDAEGNTARLERDDAGRVIAAITPLGQRTTYRYHPNGLLAARQDPDGAIWRYEHTTAGRLAAVIDPLGGRSSVEYGTHGEEERSIDPLGRAITRTLDDLGNLARVELPDGTAWNYAHDALSRLTAITDPAGQNWSRTYSPSGVLTSMTDPTGVATQIETDATRGAIRVDDGLMAQTTGLDPLGRPVTARQSDGSSAINTYDACGRVVEVLDPEGGLTRIERDVAGRITAMTTPMGAITRYGYDTCGRLATVSDPAGAVTTRVYDANGRLIRQILPTGEQAVAEYDDCGRLVMLKRPGRGIARYGYDKCGRLTRSYDTYTGPCRYAYDAAGQLVAATNALGGITRYDYDACGRVATITDPAGGMTRRTWDAMNHLVAETDPLGRTTSAGYDAAGRQIWQQDPTGQRTSWEYDASGRVRSSSIDGELVARIDRDLTARSVTITDHTGRAPATQQLAWDRLGNLIAQVKNGRSIEWTYDADGRRTAMHTPDGHTIEYSYDRAGNLAAIEHPVFGRAAFDHDPSGRLIGAATGELMQAWAYGADGTVVEHSITGPDGARRTLIARDDEGRVVGVEEGGQTTAYTYDAAGQLASATGACGVLGWSYDAAGRMTSRSADGGTTTYGYDLAGQLVATHSGQRTVQFGYDGVGRRIREEDEHRWAREYRWSKTGYLAGVVEHDGDQVRETRLHVDANGQLSTVDGDQVWWDTAAYAPTPILTGDQPVLATGAATGIDQEWAIPGWRTGRHTGADPWATPAPSAGGAMAVGPSGEVTIGGLEWLDRRVYDPASCAMLSVDPLEQAAGPAWASNPYSYAGNNPLQLLDPSGLDPVTDADLDAYAHAHRGALSKTGDWVNDNWEYLAGGAMVIAGGFAMATGFGGPFGGMLIGAGSDMIIQKATTGEVDWGEVALSGTLGTFGGAGFVARGGPTLLRVTADAAVVGGVDGGVMSGYNYLNSPGPHNWRDGLTAVAQGTAFGTLTGGAGGAGGHGLHSLLGRGRSTAPAEYSPTTTTAKPLSTVPATPAAPRLPQDIAISAVPPPANLGTVPPGGITHLPSSIGRASHVAGAISYINALPAGVTDIRVNQHQVNALGQRVGINRPDIQYTESGVRYYVEFEVPANPRGHAHEVRSGANDPAGSLVPTILIP